MPQQAVVGDRDELEVGVRLLGQQLPRDEVGVVLHLGQDDRVAAADVAAAPGVGDQVDRLGRVAREHDLVRIRDADEAGDRRPGRLVGRGRPLADLVDPAVDVGVVLAVVVVDAVDHAASASGTSLPSRGRPAGGRGSSARGSGSRRGAQPDRAAGARRRRVGGGHGRRRRGVAGEHLIVVARWHRRRRRPGLGLGRHRSPTGLRRPPPAPGAPQARRPRRRSRGRPRAGSGRSPRPRAAARDPCHPISRSGPLPGRGRRRA